MLTGILIIVFTAVLLLVVFKPLRWKVADVMLALVGLAVAIVLYILMWVAYVLALPLLIVTMLVFIFLRLLGVL